MATVRYRVGEVVFHVNTRATIIGLSGNDATIQFRGGSRKTLPLTKLTKQGCGCGKKRKVQWV